MPVKTRHNEVAPDAVRDRADLRELERRLRPPAADDAGDAERRAQLRARLPAAREAVRRRQRLGQAQQLVDGHRHRASTCSSRATRRTRTSQFLFFCAAVIAGRRQAPGAAARVGGQRRPGPPPGRQRGAAGDHLDLPRRRAREGLRRDRVRRGRRRDHAGAYLGPGHAGPAAAAACTAATATGPRRSPSRATSSSSARSGRACRSRFPNTVLNTIVAEAIDALADELEERIERRRRAIEEAVIEVVKQRLRRQQADRLRRRQLLRGVARRRPSGAGCRTCARRPTRCRGCRGPDGRRPSRHYEVLSERELESRFEVLRSSSTRRSSTSRPRPPRRSRAR